MKATILSAVFIVSLMFGLAHFSCSSHSFHPDGYLCSGPEGGGHSDFAPGVIYSAAATLDMRLGNRTTNGSYE